MRKQLHGIGILLVAAIVAQSAATTVFFDPNQGVAIQQAQEAAFLAATPALTVIDFDDQAPDAILTGNEYAGQGITFSQPGGYQLQALADNNNFDPPSPTNSLFPEGGSGIDERLQADLVTPQLAVGLWIVDNELDSPTMTEDIVFYDANDQVIYSTELPHVGLSQGPEGNFFIGLISDVPVAKIIMNESPDEQYLENVGWDNVYFGVPEPSALLLLSLGVGLLRRR